MRKAKIFMIISTVFALFCIFRVNSYAYSHLDEVIYASQVLSGQNVDLASGHTTVVVVNDTDRVVWVNLDRAYDGTRRNISITYEKDNENYRFNNMRLNPRGGECTPISGTICVTYNEVTYVPPVQESENPKSNHTHSFIWQVIYEATSNSDGLEGEVCSCGATRNTQPISAYDYAINKYADRMIKAAKPGQKITLEFGEFNSFPRYMMEKVAARMNENITFVFKFKQNKKMQTVTIEPGTAIDLQYAWYGPDKMKELYGAD